MLPALTLVALTPAVLPPCVLLNIMFQAMFALPALLERLAPLAPMHLATTRHAMLLPVLLTLAVLMLLLAAHVTLVTLVPSRPALRLLTMREPVPQATALRLYLLVRHTLPTVTI
jgi:hypothetical protein